MVFFNLVVSREREKALRNEFETLQTGRSMYLEKNQGLKTWVEEIEATMNQTLELCEKL